jgi:hypothetical protein
MSQKTFFFSFILSLRRAEAGIEPLNQGCVVLGETAWLLHFKMLNKPGQ